jgi:glycine betaine/choline ABC-type transport system substrate-binding protein
MDRAKTLACLILAVLLTGAGCSRRPRIVVGSKNFTEQVLLGEILAQQIERRLHIAVEHKLDLGGTLLTHEALVKGSIDLYPEYTGTALAAILKQAPGGDAAAVLGRVRAAYLQWHLVWLDPLGFNNTFAMMIRGETARRDGVRNLSEAARLRPWRLGAGYEFQSRADGLDGLLRAYPLRLEGKPVAMDLGLLYPALQNRNVDMIAANSTDGLAAVLDVKIMDDDRRYFPPYQCAVVARQDTLARFPRLRAALEELSGKLPDDTMRRLNYEVDAKHRSVVEVAAAFLKDVP